MTGYADEAEAIRVLRKDSANPQDLLDKAQISQLNADLSAEIDDYMHRSLLAAGSTLDPVVWTCDAPYGPILPVPDFYQLVSVTRNGIDVTPSVIALNLNSDRRGPPWQHLVYAPAGVLTGWADGLPSSLGAVVVSVLAGWGLMLPRALVRIATRALIREWRARTTQYSGVGGDATTTLIVSTGLLTEDDKSRLASYVRPVVTAIRGGP